MPSILKQIWSVCNLAVGLIGIIGIVIGLALIDSAKEVKYTVVQKKENTARKYIGLSILLFSLVAIIYNIYYLNQKKCKKLIYKWSKKHK